MKTFSFFDFVLWNAEGGGGAGGGDGGSGDGSPSGGNPDDSSGNPGEGGGGNSGGDGASELYRPEGLAENFLGETDQQTIDNMQKALDGYRKRDSEKNIPDDVTAYAQFADDIPETIKPHIDELANDQAFARVSEKAKELGVPVEAFQAMTTELYTAAQDMGILEAPIDVEAEKAALTPDHAQHLSPQQQQQAREKRMQENFGWLDLLSQDGKSGVSKEMAEFVKIELGDSALGHQFFEAMRAKVGGQGGGPQNGTGNGSGQDAAAELDRRIGLPENTPGHRDFNQASYDQLVADLQKHHG